MHGSIVSHSACGHSAKILGPFLNVYLLFSSFIKLSWRECNYFCKYREDYLELIVSLHICLYMLMVIVYEVIHFFNHIVAFCNGTRIIGSIQLRAWMQL